MRTFALSSIAIAGGQIQPTDNTVDVPLYGDIRGIAFEWRLTGAGAGTGHVFDFVDVVVLKGNGSIPIYTVGHNGTAVGAFDGTAIMQAESKILARNETVAAGTQKLGRAFFYCSTPRALWQTMKLQLKTLTATSVGDGNTTSFAATGIFTVFYGTVREAIRLIQLPNPSAQGQTFKPPSDQGVLRHMLVTCPTNDLFTTMALKDEEGVDILACDASAIRCYQQVIDNLTDVATGTLDWEVPDIAVNTNTTLTLTMTGAAAVNLYTWHRTHVMGVNPAATIKSLNYGQLLPQNQTVVPTMSPTEQIDHVTSAIMPVGTKNKRTPHGNPPRAG